MEAPEDRGESVTLMEPLKISETSPRRERLTEMAVELAYQAGLFRGRLAESLVDPLAGLVREMNCYYSNLIEGHDTHPVDIERAMRDDFSTDPRKRDLQIEAKAHVAVQEWVDSGGLRGRALTRDGVVELHSRFCDGLPESLLTVTHPRTGVPMKTVPGALRHHDVEVGRHVPVSPGAVPRFLERFEQAYSTPGRIAGILATASAHHRLLWIHPFLDGNGRVARMMSHAALLDRLDTGGVWSVARGLARREAEYKERLMACDSPRRGDRDGRGQLSEGALADFMEFFLEVCIDQVTFMQTLVNPERIAERVQAWAEREIRERRLPPKSDQILLAVLYRGECPRRSVAPLLDVGDRQARRITRALLNTGILDSDNDRGPLRLGLPATLAGELVPGLFPEQGSGAR